MVRQWAAVNGFEFSFPTFMLDLISASLFFETPKVRPQLEPTSTVERSFLAFLHKLSFTDFSTTPTLLTSPEEFDATYFVKKFSSEKRPTFPPLCVVTPFDATPSSFTRDLDATTLTR